MKGETMLEMGVACTGWSFDFNEFISLLNMLIAEFALLL